MEVSIKENDLVVFEKTASDMSVISHENYISAGNFLREIKTKQKIVKAEFLEPKQKAASAHKSICALEKKFLDRLVSLERICSVKINGYLAEERRLKQIEQQRLQKEAEEAAAKQAAEAQKRDEEERLKTALFFEEQGFKEEAQEILEAPKQQISVAPVLVKVEEKPRAEGISTRTTYKASVTDFAALVREVASGRQPLNLLLPNEQVLNKMAGALKNELRISGVSVVESQTIVART